MPYPRISVDFEEFDSPSFLLKAPTICLPELSNIPSALLRGVRKHEHISPLKCYLLPCKSDWENIWKNYEMPSFNNVDVGVWWGIALLIVPESRT
jgi:hypothetical protein